MKVLITGGRGFIGYHLKEELKKSCQVKTIDNLFHPCLAPVDDTFNYADVRYYHEIEPYIKWADVIYHLAAQIHVDRSIEYPQETIDVNVTGTLNVLEACRKYKKKLIFASSSEVYGTQEYTNFRCACLRKEGLTKDQGDISELHPLNGQSPYAASKIAGDRLCKAYFDTYGLDVTILRNFNTFGPYQNDTSYGGVIAKFTKAALRGQPLYVYGSGEQCRDYIYITDAIAGYKLCATKKLSGRAVNIGSGATITINELAKLIKRIAKSNSRIIHTKPRRGEVKRLCADISFAQRCGFKPKTNFTTNLKEYVDWYKKFNFKRNK